MRQYAGGRKWVHSLGSSPCFAKFSFAACQCPLSCQAECFAKSWAAWRGHVEGKRLNWLVFQQQPTAATISELGLDHVVMFHRPQNRDKGEFKKMTPLKTPHVHFFYSPLGVIYLVVNLAFFPSFYNGSVFYQRLSHPSGWSERLM